MPSLLICYTSLELEYSTKVLLVSSDTQQMYYSARVQIIWALRGKINASLVTMMSFILSTFSYTLSGIVKAFTSISICLYH